jgi:DHA2 family multidrug resistance protein
MSVMGLVLYSTMALSSPFLQNVIGYPSSPRPAAGDRGSGTLLR